MTDFDKLKNETSPLAALIGNLDERDGKIIQFPGANGQPTQKQVMLWALTQSEGETARKNAYSYVRDVMKFSELDIAYDEQQCINDSKAVETLAIALRDPERPVNRFCRDGTQIRDRLKPSQIRYLFHEYLTWLKETDTDKEVTDLEKEVRELTDFVGKGYPIAARLTFIDTSTLRELLTLAVGLLAKSATEQSSDSSSPTSSAPTSSG